MGQSEFKFKEFSIKQEYSAMRVNTDAVLLGAWMSVPKGNDSRMLDIGTGTGVIALMAAQRCKDNSTGTVIDAVEIDEDACKDALLNFINSPWNNIKLNLYNYSVQRFCQVHTQKQYDLIFSNPPYFVDSLKNINQSKSVARHTDTLSQADLLKCVGGMLKRGGRFAVVLPQEQAQELLRKIDFLIQSSIGKGYPVLYPVRICKVKTTQKKIAKRFLMEFEYDIVTEEINTIEETLVMLDNGVYTNEYKKLTMDFYLYF